MLRECSPPTTCDMSHFTCHMSCVTFNYWDGDGKVYIFSSCPEQLSKSNCLYVCLKVSWSVFWFIGRPLLKNDLQIIKC